METRGIENRGIQKRQGGVLGVEMGGQERKDFFMSQLAGEILELEFVSQVIFMVNGSFKLRMFKSYRKGEVCFYH